MNTDLIKIFAMGCKYYAEEIDKDISFQRIF